jgi:hypothetical protein
LQGAAGFVGTAERGGGGGGGEEHEGGGDVHGRWISGLGGRTGW